jgi:pimeloyl-ACP methyl ester carboxylesterase
MGITRLDGTLTVAERRLRLAGTETRELGVAGEGVPWLLLHGYADSADTWRPVLERLGAAGRPAMAIDLTGFGTASALEPGMMLPQWDELVAAAVSELSASVGGGEVLVAGNSLGGCLSMRAAQSSELPIAGVVPIAPAGLHMARWFGVIESERLVRLLKLSPVPVPQIAVREVVGRVYRGLAFANPRGADAAAVASFTRHMPSVSRASEILETGRRLLPELESPFRLGAIDCPLLLVWGDQDRMVFTTGAERVLRAVPYSDLEVLERCGHCPQVETPDRVAEILLEFPESMSQD